MASESVLYFAPTTCDPLSQFIPSFEDLKKEIESKSLQVYTKYFKNVVSTLLSAHPESSVVDPDFLHFVSLPTALSDLDIPIAHRKGK